MEATTSQSSVLIIFLGASQFPLAPNLTSAAAFATSHKSFKAYFLDAQGFGLSNQQNILDLFDNTMNSVDLDAHMADWIRERTDSARNSGSPIQDLIIYYIGHGGFRDDSHDYFLAIRATRERQPYFSSIPIASLANTLREEARHLRRFIILDACFAGAATTNFMSPIEEVVKTKVQALAWDDPVIPHAGTALLCSSSKHAPSMYLDNGHTMFSGAFLRVLRDGSVRLPRKLSLKSLCQLVWENIRLEHKNNGVRPELHAPDQRHGDIASYPLFPNPTHVDRVEETNNLVYSEEENIYTVGIDFGTTSSLIATMRGEKPVIIPNSLGYKLTPSVVAFDQNGKVVVGNAAVAQSLVNADRTIFSVKRHLGTNWNITIDGMEYEAKDIASYIFASLKQDAEAYFQHSVTGAVIAVPAYFNHKQRDETRCAAEKGGFTVLRFVAEPTAAAMAFGLGRDHDQRSVFIYDLGGGTFDVSILELGTVEDNFVAEVIAINGSTKLGGDDFDNRLINYVIKDFTQKYGVDLSQDKTAWFRIREECERAKITLTGLAQARIVVPFIASDSKGSFLHLDLEITRERFERLICDLVDESIHYCKLALKDYFKGEVEDSSTGKLDNILPAIRQLNFDNVILVGLSTKIPMIREKVAQLLNKQPQAGIDPDEAVVIGVAHQAAVVGNIPSKRNLLLEATPFGYGVETKNGECEIVIGANRTIPTRAIADFSSVSGKQSSILVHILEGKSKKSSGNYSIGYIKLDKLPFQVEEKRTIRIVFDIDTNGGLFVTVSDVKSGVETYAMLILNSSKDADIYPEYKRRRQFSSNFNLTMGEHKLDELTRP